MISLQGFDMLKAGSSTICAQRRLKWSRKYIQDNHTLSYLSLYLCFVALVYRQRRIILLCFVFICFILIYLFIYSYISIFYLLSSLYDFVLLLMLLFIAVFCFVVVGFGFLSVCLFVCLFFSFFFIIISFVYFLFLSPHINPRLTKLLFVTRLTKGDCYNPLPTFSEPNPLPYIPK